MPSATLVGFCCCCWCCCWTVRSWFRPDRHFALQVLGSDHKTINQLRYVFGDEHEDLKDEKTQSRILDFEEFGRKSSELHASSIFPEVFGSLSKADIQIYFNEKRIKMEWTKQRKVPTAGSVMELHRKNV